MKESYELLKSRWDGEAYDVLMSLPVKRREAISCACEAISWLEGEISSLLRDFGSVLLLDGVEFLQPVAEELDRSVLAGASVDYWRRLARYLKGDREEVLLLQAAEERWSALRARILKRVRGLVLERVREVGGSDGSLREGMEPVLRQLQRRSLDAVSSEEVVGKDVVKLYGEMARLYGQLTGELSNKAELEIGPSEMWREMMKSLPAQVVDVEAEFEVLE